MNTLTALDKTECTETKERDDPPYANQFLETGLYFPKWRWNAQLGDDDDDDGLSPLFILSFSSHPERICPIESRSVSPDKSFHSLERPTHIYITDMNGNLHAEIFTLFWLK